MKVAAGRGRVPEFVSRPLPKGAGRPANAPPLAGGSRRPLRGLVLPIGLLLSCAWAWGAVGAQAPAGREASALLVNQAMAALGRGEDATDSAAKSAAYREGRELARQAIEADEANPDAHYAMFATNGRIMEMEGAVANLITVFRAKKELDRALELDPDHARSVAAKGIMLHRLPWLLGGRDGKAEQFLLRAIELDPHVVDARVELARLYAENGEPERAVAVLRDAAAAGGSDREAAEVRRLLADYENRPEP